MVNGLHAIFSWIGGDGFADKVVGVIQWVAFAIVIYLVVAALGLFGIALPEGVSSTEAIMVMLPLLVIAAPNTVSVDSD